MSHTPGPWSVGIPQTRGARGEWPEVPVHVGEFSNRGNSIALVYMGGDGATLSTSDAVLANAHLIAAAPEMLEMLIEASDELSKYEDAYHNGERYIPNSAARLRQEIEELIAKAGGRQ